MKHKKIYLVLSIHDVFRQFDQRTMPSFSRCFFFASDKLITQIFVLCSSPIALFNFYFWSSIRNGCILIQLDRLSIKRTLSPVDKKGSCSFQKSVKKRVLKLRFGMFCCYSNKRFKTTRVNFNWTWCRIQQLLIKVVWTTNTNPSRQSIN